MIIANGENYLVRKVVDRAVCSNCGDRDAEISCTLGVANSPAFSYPDYGKQ